jgi:hypothetical protein
MRKMIPVILLASVLSPEVKAQAFFENTPPLTEEERQDILEEGVADPEDEFEEEDTPQDMGVTNPLESNPSITPSSVTYPPYRIRYLADIIERDEGQDRLVEEGVFNTTAQANEVINILAHLRVAHFVDCTCEDYRRDAVGATLLEDSMLEMLRDYGYVSRLVPSSQVAALPDFVGVMTPYLILSGNGFRENNYGGYNFLNGGNWWNDQWGASTTPTFNPNDPRQYARVDHLGIFVDTRIETFVQNRVIQLMGGYRLDDPVSLCAFAALDRSLDDMMSWVLIKDLRRNWGQ